MAKNHFEQLKPIALLVLFLFGWWIIPGVVKSFLKAGFYEFQAPFYATTSHLDDLQKYWELRNHSKKELIETGRDLARQRAFYSLNNQQVNALRDEIKQLEKLLDLPSKPEYHYEVARVAQRSLSGWWQQLILRKGKNYNIPVGAAVVYSDGVVGRIREVHAYTSVVELVSSPGFRMAANLEGESRPVTFQGASTPAFSSPEGVVLNVPPEFEITPDNPIRLVSSELGGIFPQGLTIGQIVSLEAGPDGFFLKGRVLLDPDLSSLKEVAIIIPITGESDVH